MSTYGDLINAQIHATRIELDDTLSVEGANLVRALGIWEALRRGRPMPSRADIDPVQMPACVLPHIMLTDVERRPRLRFRWRLLGTNVTRIMGRDATGRYWDELYDADALAVIEASARAAIESGRPIRSVATVPTERAMPLRIEKLTLPLSEDGRKIDKIWDVIAFRRGPFPWEAQSAAAARAARSERVASGSGAPSGPRTTP